MGSRVGKNLHHDLESSALPLDHPIQVVIRERTRILEDVTRVQINVYGIGSVKGDRGSLAVQNLHPSRLGIGDISGGVGYQLVSQGVNTRHTHIDGPKGAFSQTGRVAHVGHDFTFTVVIIQNAYSGIHEYPAPDTRYKIWRSLGFSIDKGNDWLLVVNNSNRRGNCCGNGFTARIWQFSNSQIINV